MQVAVVDETNARSWARLTAFMASRLPVAATGAQELVVTSRDGRPVFVEQVHGSSGDWIVMRAKICAAHEMDPALVLERNGRLAFAVMVLVKGVYWLRVAIPIDSGELNDPTQLVDFLVDAARSLSPYRPVTSFAHATETFQHYTE